MKDIIKTAETLLHEFRKAFKKEGSIVLAQLIADAEKVKAQLEIEDYADARDSCSIMIGHLRKLNDSPEKSAWISIAAGELFGRIAQEQKEKLRRAA